MEAVIAAVYLDAGFEAARALVLRLWGGRIAAVEADARDAKTALQEWAQARGMPPPAYVEAGRVGPGPPAGLHRRGAAGESGETAEAAGRIEAAWRNRRPREGAAGPGWRRRMTDALTHARASSP